MSRSFTILGAALAFAGVGLGAFGAHGLSAYFAAHPDAEATFHTATQYLMYHALGLLAVAWVSERWPGSLTRWSGILLALGAIIFSGSLMILSLAGLRWMGAIAPIGGIAMLGGWLCLGLAAWRGEKNREPRV